MTKVRIIKPTYEDRYKQIAALEKKKKELKAKYMPTLERTDAFKKAARGLWTTPYMEYKTQIDDINGQIMTIKANDYKFICYLNKRRREDAK